jgi:uncharacterized protein YkwD
VRWAGRQVLRALRFAVVALVLVAVLLSSGVGLDVLPADAVSETVDRITDGQFDPDEVVPGLAPSGAPVASSDADRDPDANATAGDVSRPSVGYDYDEVERLVVAYTNDERTERGLEPVSQDDALAAIARGHSADMATRGYFSHVSPEGETVGDRYADAGYSCRVPMGGMRYATGSENIAQTWIDRPVATDGGVERITTEEELARQLVEGWMNSPSHRENILTPEWRNLGVGVYITEAGKVYATQNFC